MSKPFDPYYTWLGIPKKDQPPNHYRLLGLEVFEPDADVIENAADRQMAHVRTFQTGGHGELSQKILNEISSAKVCLLSADRKQAYDMKLRSELKTRQAKQAKSEPSAAPSPSSSSPSAARPMPKAKPLPTAKAPHRSAPRQASDAEAIVVIDDDEPMIDTGEDESSSLTATRRPKSDKQWWQQPWPYVAGSAFVVAILVVVIAGGGGDAVAEKDKEGSGDKNDKQTDTTDLGNPADKKGLLSGANGKGATNGGNQDVSDRPEEGSGTGPTIVRDTPDTGQTVTDGAKEVSLGEGLPSNFALRLPGRGSVELTETRELLRPDAEFTAEMWVKFDSRGESQTLMGNAVVGSQHPSVESGKGAGWALVVRRVDGGHRMELLREYLGKGQFTGPSVAIRPPGSGWHHVAVTMRSRRHQVYFDGQPLIDRADTDPVLASPSNLFLGIPLFADTNWRADVQIRGFRLDQRVLYDGPFSPPRQLVRGADTAVLLDFSRTESNLVYDASGRGRHGKLSSSSWLVVRDPIPQIDDSQQVVINEPMPPKDGSEPPDEGQTGDDDSGLQVAGRVPVPDDEKLKEVMGTIREIFQQEYRDAGSPEKKKALAEKLLAQAQQTTNDNDARYALLQETNRLAVEAGALDLALNSVDQIVSEYEVDRWGQRVDVLFEVARELSGGSERVEIAEEASTWSEQAADAERYDVALKLTNFAATTFQRARLYPRAKEEREQAKKLEAQQGQWEEAQAAEAKLAESPDDKDAHLTLGKYYVFVKRDFEQGLEHLAQGSDEALAAIARQEQAEEKGAEAVVELAEAWYGWGDDVGDKDLKQAAWRRAQSLYLEAAPKLSGLSKVKVDKQLEKLAEQVEPDGAVRVGRLGWLDNAKVGQIKTLQGHTDDVLCLAVSSSGRYAASGSDDSTARVWDLESGEQISQVNVGSNTSYSGRRVTALAITPDEKHLFIGRDGEGLAVVELKTGKAVRIVPTRYDTRQVALTPDGRKLVWCGYAYGDGVVHVLDVKSGRSLGQFRTPNSINALEISPDGKLAAIASGEVVFVWNLSTGEAAQLAGHEETVTDVCFLKGSSQVAAGGYDDTVRIWNVRDAKQVQVLNHQTSVYSLASTPDGKRLLTGGFSTSLRLWDVEKGEQIQRLTMSGSSYYSATDICMLPDPRGAISSTRGNSIHVWRLPD